MLPQDLVAGFDRFGAERGARLGDALALGLHPEAHPPEPLVPNSADAAERKAQAATNLVHFSGRYWYLSLTVAQLHEAVQQLERQLKSFEPSPAESEEVRRPLPDPPALASVNVHAAEVDVAEARRQFRSDGTFDPAATAICFGAAVLLLGPVIASNSTEEILEHVSRYWAGVATLQYRAYVLDNDQQVLKFRLAAARSEAAMKARLSRDGQPDGPRQPG